VEDTLDLVEAAEKPNENINEEDITERFIIWKQSDDLIRKEYLIKRFENTLYELMYHKMNKEKFTLQDTTVLLNIRKNAKVKEVDRIEDKI